MSPKLQLAAHHANSRRNRVGLTTSNKEIELLVHDWVSEIEILGKRKLSKRQRITCFDTLLCLCLDLFSASQTDPPTWIGYSRGKKTFIRGGAYWDNQNDQPLLSHTYSLKGIHYLSGAGLIKNVIAEAGYSTFSSRMQATPDLVAELEARNLNWTHVHERPDTDSIVVKDEDKKPTKWPDPADFPLDSALNNLKLINLQLQKTLVNINISDEELTKLNNRADGTADDDETDRSIQSKIDFTNRKVRRIFSKSSFEVGGRFYGGWWQGVPGEYRKFIEINGCPTVELDYATIQPRILYASVGQQPPKDSYLVPGWDPELRKVTKKAFSQLLNSDPSSRHPNQWHRFAPDFDPSILPDDWDVLTRFQRAGLRRKAFVEATGRGYDELIADLLQYHGPIESHFFSSVWGATKSKDAKIVEKVLLKLLGRDVPEVVLPIHDSFIVRYGREQLLYEAMQEAFKEVVGEAAVIDEDDTIFIPPEGYDGSVLEFQLNTVDIPPNKFQTHAGYFTRNEEWEASYGPVNNNDIMFDAINDILSDAIVETKVNH